MTTSSLLIRIRAYVLRFFSAIIHFVTHRPRTTTAVVVVTILAGILLAQRGNTPAPSPSEGNATLPTVTLATVGSLQQNGIPVILTGEVRSLSQAELHAQKSGKVTAVYVRTGQRVAAGTVLAEIEHLGEQAAVLQAQGALAAAQANLTRVKNGTRIEDRLSATAGAESASAALNQTQEQARTVLTSAYTTAQDVILAKTDTFFSNPYTVRPSFRVHSASYTERRALEDERVAIGTLLDTWNTELGNSPSDEELDSALATAQVRLERIGQFVNRVTFFVSTQEESEDTTSTQIAMDTALVRAAQQAVDGAKSSVASIRTGLANARSVSTVASLSETKASVERPEDVQVAEAGVLQARGVLAGATAALEQALIRTPIAGTITSFSVARGDFVSMQQPVAVVANEAQAQEVVVYVSEDVRDTLHVGMEALVDGRYAGIITGVDPGLDPVTKRARVTVGVPEDASLTNGAFVEVAVTQDGEDGTAENDAERIRAGWYLPISAIKVLPDGLVVFTVTEEHTLAAHPITEGTIVGDRMLIPDDLAPELRIVTDVRGLSIGEQVKIPNE